MHTAIIFMHEKLYHNDQKCVDIRFDNQLLPRGVIVIGIIVMSVRGEMEELWESRYTGAFSEDQRKQLQKVANYGRAVLRNDDILPKLEIEPTMI